VAEKCKLKNRITISTAIIIFTILTCIACVSGFDAFLISPTDINNVYPGDTVMIRIDGLLTGNAFTTRLTSTDLATSGGTVTFSNFNMAFGFATGTATTTLTTTGIPGDTTLLVKEADDTTNTITGTGTPNTITSNRDITKQVYKTISISGTPSGSTIAIDYTVGGTSVSGIPAASEYLTFTLNGINTGNLRIRVNDATSLDKTLRIVASPVPQPSYEQGASSSVASSSGPAAAPAAAAAAVAPAAQPVTVPIAKEGQTLTTLTVSTPTEATVEASVTVDQGTTIIDPAGNFVNSVSVSPVSVQDVPSMPEGAGFSFSGYAVQCGPEGVTFSQPAALTFSLTPEQWDAALAQANGNPSLMSVQYYDKESASWVSVPTTVDEGAHTVTGHVSHFSLFALIIVQAPPATPAAEVPITAGLSPTVTTAPKVSLAKTPTPKPTPTPFVSIPAMIGVLVVVGMAYTLARKK
jgi:hypothetical protein